MTLGERIREAREAARLSQKELGLALREPMGRATVSSWENNRTEPTSAQLQEIADITKTPVARIAFGSEEKNVVHEAPGKYITLPILTVCPSAGAGAIVEEELPMETSISFSEEYLRLMKVRTENLRALTVAGESMQPLLFAGDVIVVDVSQHELNEDGVYVIRHDGKVKVKKLHGLGRGRIKIISLHPDYEPIIVGPDDPPDELSICGRVVWAGRRM